VVVEFVKLEVSLSREAGDVGGAGGAGSSSPPPDADEPLQWQHEMNWSGTSLVQLMLGYML